MRPVLFNIPIPWLGAIPVRAYGFMVMLGCLVGVFVVLRRARREGADRNVIWDMWMWSLVGGFAGARAFYVYLFWPQFSGHLVRVFYIWEGGLAFQGGLVGAILLTYVYLKVKRLSAAKYIDMFVAGVILGYAFARVGCFLNGCCHGHVADVPWAVTYPAYAPINAKGTFRPSPAYAAQVAGDPRLLPDWAGKLPGCEGRVNDGRLIDTYSAWVAMGGQAGGKGPMPRSCPIHPTQLYAAASALIIFVVLLVYSYVPRRIGQETGLFGMLYAVYRFVVEFFRGDSPTPHWGLTLFQVVCIGIFVTFGLYWLYCMRWMPRYVPPAERSR